jgi:predicted metal-binding protein
MFPPRWFRPNLCPPNAWFRPKMVQRNCLVSMLVAAVDVPAEEVLLLVPLEATDESLGLELLSGLDCFPRLDDGVVPQEARPNRAALRRTTY